MKLHKFDAISFISGLVIAIIGLVFLLPAEITDLVDFVTNVGTWFWPTVFIAIGALILVPLLLRSPEKKAEDEF